MQKSQPGVAAGFKFVIGGVLAAVVICLVMIIGYLSLPGARDSGLPPNPPTSADKKSPSNDQRPQVTLSQYNQLKEGMSYSDVVKTLGREGKLAHQNQTTRDTFKSYGWKFEGARFTYIDITFKNDQLLSKIQYGLE
jgi:hypothetical protein